MGQKEKSVVATTTDYFCYISAVMIVLSSLNLLKQNGMLGDEAFFYMNKELSAPLLHAAYK